MRSILITLILVCSACSLAPDYERPEVPLSEDYTAPISGVSIVNLAWWDFFQDPALKDLIKLALEQNKDLAIAWTRINQARALAGISRANQFPELSIGGEAERGSNSELINALDQGTQNLFGVFADLSFEVDLWGRLRNASAADRKRLLASEYAMRTLMISLISEVAKNYFQILTVHKKINVAQRTIKNRKDSTAILQARLSKGVVPELDVDQATIEQMDAEIELTRLDREHAQAQHALSILLGWPASIVVNDFAQLPASLSIPQALPADLLERRPDILESEAETQARMLNIGVARAERLPTLALFGTIGQQSIEFEDLDSGDAFTWGVGGNLLGPLIDFGRRRSAVEFAEARAEEALRAYEAVVIKATQEVEDALISIDTFNTEQIRRATQIKSATNAARLSRARYDQGFTSYLEVLDIERSLFAAELENENARFNYLSSIINLYKALGGGWDPNEISIG